MQELARRIVKKALLLRTRGPASRRPKGMTLLEIMIVIAILGLIASVVVVAVMNNFERAKIKTSQLKIGDVHRAMDMYLTEFNEYPSTSEGIKQLTSPPNGPAFLKDVPKDAWGQEFVYFNPARGGGAGVEIISKGPDKKEGTEDDIKK